MVYCRHLTKRPAVFTTAIALTAVTVVAGGFSTANPVDAQSNGGGRRSTTTKAPSTVPMYYGGINGTRTKNAALPTTTTKSSPAKKAKPKPTKKKSPASTTVAPAGK